jgi:hypothetical protein
MTSCGSTSAAAASKSATVPYNIDDRTMGRMLCALARYDKFEPGSLHDEGVLLFAGFHVAFKIETVDNELVMRVWVNQDALQGA